MAKMQGREAIAKVLKASGVECVFGLSGGFPPIPAPLVELGIKVFTVRNEMDAAFMATGYSRIASKPGVCICSGIGAAHLAVGLREAQFSTNPVLAITSEETRRMTWRTHMSDHFIDQDPLFKPIAKWMVHPDVMHEFPELVRTALEVATAGVPGVVSVIVPNRLLGEEVDFEVPAEWGEVHCPKLRMSPEAESIERAAKLLLDAKRPAIVAGGGVMLSRASEELVELAELLVAPVASSPIAQTAFPNKHPLSLGVMGSTIASGRGRVANKIVAEADVVLFVGIKMDNITTNDWTLPPAATSKIIHIDIDPMQVGFNCPVEVGIVADAKLALQALKNALPGKVKKAPSIADTPRAKEVQTLTKEWRDEFAPLMNSNDVPIKTHRLFNEIQNFLNQDTIVVVDGPSSHWAASCLEGGPDIPIIYTKGFVTIGAGFPMAMGVQAAAPDKRVIHIAGDGGFGYNIMELETCVRYNLPVVNIIRNNQSYSFVRGLYARFNKRFFPEVTDFAHQDFSKIAQAFGAFGVRVVKPQEIKEAIAAALASGKPAIVDVVTDVQEGH